MVTPTNFQSKHYMVLPSSNFRSTSELNFMVNLSGVAVLENFKGTDDGNWRKEVVRLDGYYIAMNNVLTRVSSLLPALPPNRADGSSASWAFVPLQWTVYASFNSIFNAGTRDLLLIRVGFTKPNEQPVGHGNENLEDLVQSGIVGESGNRNFTSKGYNQEVSVSCIIYLLVVMGCVALLSILLFRN